MLRIAASRACPEVQAAGVLPGPVQRCRQLGCVAGVCQVLEAFPPPPQQEASKLRLGVFSPLTSASHTNQTYRQVDVFPHHMGNPAVPWTSTLLDFPSVTVFTSSAHRSLSLRRTFF